MNDEQRRLAAFGAQSALIREVSDTMEPQRHCFQWNGARIVQAGVAPRLCAVGTQRSARRVLNDSGRRRDDPLSVNRP